MSRWEVAFLVAFIFLVIYQLLIPPIVGLANNGDYPRIMGRFSIGFQRNDVRPGYRNFIVRNFEVGEAQLWISEFVSSQSLIMMLAVPLNNLLSKDGFFDIRSVAVANSLLLILAVWLAAVASRSWRWQTRLVFLLLVLLFFTDVDYLSYFNSFYSEPASFLFLLLTCCTALRMVQSYPDYEVWWGPLLLFSCLLVLAKPQNFLAGLILALLFFRLSRIEESKRKRTLNVSAAALVLATSIAGFALTPTAIRYATYHVAIFYELLGHSPDPVRDLKELRLDPALVRFAGSHPWSSDPPSIEEPYFVQTFIDHFHWSSLILFYLHHPTRLVQSLDRSSREALLREDALGNFERDANYPPGARSRAVAVWSGLRERFAPKNVYALGLFFVIYAAVLARLWIVSRSVQRRLMIEIAFGVMAIALSQFLTVTITSGTIDTRKHMHLFKTSVDILLLFAAGWGTTTLFSKLSGDDSPEPRW